MTIPMRIFKAYDRRRLYPEELDEAAAERIGCARRAAARGCSARRRHGSAPIVSGCSRPSPPALRAAPPTVDFGLRKNACTSASPPEGWTAAPCSTASHNPPQYTH